MLDVRDVSQNIRQKTDSLCDAYDTWTKLDSKISEHAARRQQDKWPLEYNVVWLTIGNWNF